MNSIHNYYLNHKKRFHNELFSLLEIPSISADPAFEHEVKNTASKLCESLEWAGADRVAVMPTQGHPVVYAEKITDPTLPTVLVYGHYDVQPPDPVELWESPPFSPEIRDGAIYARGAADDKGQLFLHVKALEWMNANLHFPCNLKYLFEGEEEIGSPSLGDFIVNQKELLKADVVLITDTAILSEDQPSIIVGVKGVSIFEIEVTGPDRDIHSGLYGGAVANPINALCEMVGSLKDENRKITIPGFYDDVIEPTVEEKEHLQNIPFDLESFQQGFGILGIDGETGYDTLERIWFRPTLDVNGIWGGYTSQGIKTIIPSNALPKSLLDWFRGNHLQKSVNFSKSILNP